LRLLDADELLSAIVGHGQKEAGHDLRSFDRDLPYSADWQDMERRLKLGMGEVWQSRKVNK